MLENFHIVAIIKEQTEWKLQRISLDGTLQNTLANEWAKQYQRFINDKEEKDFSIAYTLGIGEVFTICPYKLPDWLAGKDSENIRNTEQAPINASLARSVKGVVAFARDDEDNELMLFQNFTRSQVIGPGGLIMRLSRSRNTYTSIEDSALRLNNRLVAVYSPKEETLLFDSFRSVNTFLPLSDHYYTASEEDIDSLLSHKLFKCQDKQKIVDNATQFIRRRFAILKDSEILDRLSAEDVRDRAARYNVEIPVQHDKIVFPTENDDAKVVLQFLNEEIFQGALTDEFYETNSKKKANL